MRFFSHAWAACEDEGEVRDVIARYQAQISTFSGSVGRDIRLFSRRFDLRGALLDSIVIDAKAEAVTVGLVSGDRSSGYFTLSINYLGCTLQANDIPIVERAFQSRRAQLRFDEFDRNSAVPASFVHRFLLWPREFGELEFRFTKFETATRPVEGRKYNKIVQPVRRV